MRPELEGEPSVSAAVSGSELVYHGLPLLIFFLDGQKTAIVALHGRRSDLGIVTGHLLVGASHGIEISALGGLHGHDICESLLGLGAAAGEKEGRHSEKAEGEQFHDVGLHASKMGPTQAIRV